MADLIYSVKDVFGSFLGEKTHYNIPEYQRGYKWEAKYVEILLDDFYEFFRKERPNDDFYCLQNITLIDKGNFYNVADGQQRLTTLSILLSYFGKDYIKGFEIEGKIKYPISTIRHITSKFLNEFIFNDNPFLNVYEISWEYFNEQTDNEYDYQDIFYICSTARTIKNWFDNKKLSWKPKFISNIIDNVKLIINNLRETDEEKVFGNVNSKRIPLDGSDLIRAIVITKVPKKEMENVTNREEREYKIKEKRFRIGWELDQLNNWWTQGKVKSYFKKFSSIDSIGDISFDINDYPLNLLYILYAEQKGATKLDLQFIEKQDSKQLYFELIQLDAILKDWYDDKEIYHYLGYLFSRKSNNKESFFKEIIIEWSKSTSTRSSFKEYLKETIKSDLLYGKNDSDKTDIELFEDLFPERDNKNWYSKDFQGSLVKVLLLMDIIHITKFKDNFIKLPAFAFSRKGDDIEHIFPKNPDPKDNKLQKEFIHYLNEHIVENSNEKFDLKEFDNNYQSDDYQPQVKFFIATNTKHIDLNSLGNLVLLNSSLNRKIQCTTYSNKRVAFLQFGNEGNFIHPHTSNIFVRNFYSENMKKNNNLDFWEQEDIENSYQSIINELITFFDIQIKKD
jgi:uncharacterized protein with ParB-like and HNH nuclease domain